MHNVAVAVVQGACELGDDDVVDFEHGSVAPEDTEHQVQRVSFLQEQPERSYCRREQ